MSLDLSLDVKCSITTAILSVLVYLLLVNLMRRNSNLSQGLGEEMNDANWYKSMEFMMLISVFIGYNLNYYFFNSCKVL